MRDTPWGEEGDDESSEAKELADDEPETAEDGPQLPAGDMILRGLSGACPITETPRRSG